MKKILFSIVFLCLIGACSSGGSGGSSKTGVPEAFFTVSTPYTIAGAEIYFNASGSSVSEGSIVSYLWNFGDGKSGSGIEILHSFDSDGTYDVILTVTADSGKKDTYSISVIVSSSGTVLGQTGGMIEFDEGRVFLSIPPGALASDVGISIAKKEKSPAGAVTGSVYSLYPDGIVFEKPVSFVICYDKSDLPSGYDENDLWIGKIAGSAALNWIYAGDCSVDVQNCRVTAELSGFSDYGLVSGNVFSEISETVYVEDNPDPKEANKFDSIENAVAYLNNSLSSMESGKIIINSDNKFSISSISLERHIYFEAGSGFNPSIEGKDNAPLVINTAGAFGLGNLSAGSAGLDVNAMSDVFIIGSFIGELNVFVGSPDKTVLSDSSQSDVCGSIWSFKDTEILGPFKFEAGSKIDGRLEASGLTAPSLDFSNTSYGSVKASINKNITKDLRFEFLLSNDAYAKISEHADLESMSLVFDLLDDTDISLSAMTSALALIKYKGQGIAHVKAEANSLGKADYSFGTSGTVEFKSSDEIVGNSGESSSYTVLSGTVNLNHTKFFAKGAVKYKVNESSFLNLEMESSVSYQGSFIVSAYGDFRGILSNETEFLGYTKFQASGEIMNLKSAGANFKSGLAVNTEYVDVSANVSLGGESFGSIVEGAPFDFNPPGSGSAIFSAENVTFSVGVNIFLDSKSEQSTGDENKIPASAASSYLFKNCTIKGGILFREIDGTIELKNSSVEGEGGIGFNNVSGSSLINGCSVEGNGILYTMSSNTLTVQQTDVTASGAGMACFATMSGKVLIDQSSLNGSGGACTVYAAGDQKVVVSSSSSSGKFIIAGEGVLSLVNNIFSGAEIIDGNQSGGLVNDPMADGNTGLIPSQISSLVDWDGNGCADYAGEGSNIKDGNGECGVDGVMPASL
ncbi:MAG: PKD domain-containing protein [Desulfobacteraceae bacterium]